MRSRPWCEVYIPITVRIPWGKIGSCIIRSMSRLYVVLSSSRSTLYQELIFGLRILLRDWFYRCLYLPMSISRLWNSMVRQLVSLNTIVNLTRLLAPECQQKACEKTINGEYSMPDEIQEIETHTLTGEWVIWDDSTRPPSELVILFLHGGKSAIFLFVFLGAFFSCTPQTHRQLTYRYAKETGARVFSLAYRKAPKNPFPAGIYIFSLTHSRLTWRIRRLSIPHSTQPPSFQRSRILQHEYPSA
jgi:hypothetical protein